MVSWQEDNFISIHLFVLVHLNEKQVANKRAKKTGATEVTAIKIRRRMKIKIREYYKQRVGRQCRR